MKYIITVVLKINCVKFSTIYLKILVGAPKNTSLPSRSWYSRHALTDRVQNGPLPPYKRRAERKQKEKTFYKSKQSTMLNQIWRKWNGRCWPLALYCWAIVSASRHLVTVCCWASIKNPSMLFGTTGKQGMNAAEQVPAKQKPLSKSSGDPRAGALCLVRVWVLSSRNTVRHLLVTLLSSHGLPRPLVAALVADDLLGNHKLVVRELSRSSQSEISI